MRLNVAESDAGRWDSLFSAVWGNRIVPLGRFGRPKLNAASKPKGLRYRLNQVLAPASARSQFAKHCNTYYLLTV